MLTSVRPGAGQGVHRGFTREIAPRPQAGRSGRKHEATRFQGGTKTGSARAPKSAVSRARPAAKSDATAWQERSGGNSLFLRLIAWLTWHHPCWRTARRGDREGQVSHIASPGSAAAGMTASEIGM